MHPLQILKDSPTEPEGYIDRLTVKAVVFNEKNEVLLFGGALLGGGVEEGEDLSTALERECLEEAGITIEILKPLGVVIQFRDVWKKRYVIHGFLARFLAQKSQPTTLQENEKKRTVAWYAFTEADQLLTERIQALEQEGDLNPTQGLYQAQLFNMKTAQIFLRSSSFD